MFARIPPNLLARATLVRSAVIVVALIVVVVGCNLLMAKQPVAVVASPSPTPTVSPSPTASPTPSPTPKPTPSPLLSKRITILVLGNDSNASRLARGMGKLTDSIIVLSVNAKHTQISMISFPRDIVDIPMDNGSIWSGKINSITYYRGEAAMKRAISATIGQPINYYIEVNMEDFGRLVNAIHGIDVIVPASIYDPSIGFSIRAGRRHLDGNAALSYSRSRHTTSDWDRDARQQLVLAAIVRKLVDPKTKVDIHANPRHRRLHPGRAPLGQGQGRWTGAGPAVLRRIHRNRAGHQSWLDPGAQPVSYPPVREVSPHRLT